MSNIKELIRAEIKKRRLHFDKEAEKYQAINNGYSRKCYGARDALRDLENFLDTLPEEPEKPTRGYDEAYLNEKIAKASKSWEGVDVDKFMDEIRGREPVTTCDQLEEAAEAYSRQVSRGHNYRDLTCGFIGGAEWQKRKMMEGAVEGDVWGQVGKNINISVLRGVCKYLEQEDLPYKVRMIILPKED